MRRPDRSAEFVPGSFYGLCMWCWRPREECPCPHSIAEAREMGQKRRKADNVALWRGRYYQPGGWAA